VYACTIIGLKYTGGEDEFPYRVGLGSKIELERERTNPYSFGAVAAYHDERKIGYLSDENRAAWKALSTFASHPAKVVGEITDESGKLAGLDVEVLIPDTEAVEALDNRSLWRAIRAATGVVVLFASLTTMGALQGLGPSNYQGAGVEVADVYGRGDLHISGQTAVEAALGLTLPAKFGSDEQAGEAGRKSYEAAAHRLAEEQKRRDRLAEELRQTEMHKVQQLAQDLQSAQAAIRSQQAEMERLADRFLNAETNWMRERQKLYVDIARLEQEVGELNLARQMAEEEVRNVEAWRSINAEELARKQQRVTAWKLVKKWKENALAALETQRMEKKAVPPPPRPKVAAEAAPSRRPKVVAEPAPAPPKVRKKTNFSRYAP
jgi:hypothetical protein